MTEYDLEKARQLKSEGNDFSQIRTYLTNLGLSDNEISQVFRIIDDEEINMLRRKQQVSKARAELIGSLIFLILGIAFNIYRINQSEGFEVFSVTIPLTTFVFMYLKYKRMSNTNFTTSQILKYNRRYRAGK